MKGLGRRYAPDPRDQRCLMCDQLPMCRVRSCVNPSHLEVVSHQTNVLRGIGPTSVNATKSHCIHGHMFTPENILPQTSKGRECRKCHNRRNSESQKKRLFREACTSTEAPVHV